MTDYQGPDRRSIPPDLLTATDEMTAELRQLSANVGNERKSRSRMVLAVVVLAVALLAASITGAVAVKRGSDSDRQARCRSDIAAREANAMRAYLIDQGNLLIGVIERTRDPGLLANIKRDITAYQTVGIERDHINDNCK